jgi:scyllo-inositol 2-dehydrogenase (NADP+)
MQPISTALLSYGMSGKVFHAPLLRAHGGFSVDAVVMRNPQPISFQTNIYAHIDDVLALPNIELVVVNLPNEFHYAVAAQALRAGKHVVLEKPMTVTSTEAKSLIALAQAQNRMLTVFQNRRWDGDFLTVQKIISQGLLGRIVEYEAHYDRFRNYVQPNTWKEAQGPGSGILYNLGSHMIDQALTLFGKPIWVDARVGVQRTSGQVDDYYDIRMQYADKLIILKSSYLVREPGPRYVVHGEQGSFVKYGLDPQEQALAEGHLPGSVGWGLDLPEYWGKLNTEHNSEVLNVCYETLPGNYPAFYDGVYQAIRKGTPPPVAAQEALTYIEIIEACYESNCLKRAVEIG